MIELRQLVGKRREKGEVVTIAHPTDQVLRDGRRIGFVARHAGAYICFTDPHITDSERAAIRQEVSKIRLEDGRFGDVAERTSKPPIIPDEEGIEIDDELYEEECYE